MVCNKRKHSESESISTADGIPMKRMRTEGSSSNGETELTTRESSPAPTNTAEENEVLLIILPKDDKRIVENDTFAEAESAPEDNPPDSAPHLEDIVKGSESEANEQTTTVDQQKSTSPTPPEKEFFLGPWSPSWPQNSHPTFDKSSPSPSEEEEAFDFLQNETEGASPTSQIAPGPEAASPPSLDASRRDNSSVPPIRVRQVDIEEGDNEEEDLPFGVPLLLLIPDDTDDS